MAAVSERPELAAIREYMIVDGKPLAVGVGRVAVYDPAAGEVIAQQVEAGPEQVDAAVHAAKRALESSPWRDMVPAMRERLLLRLADRIETESDALARLETLSNGRPLMISRMLVAGA
jgi:phenylacetaldehyde dehydrogenase